ncbi:AAA family ATPase [Nonomuraea insulae]|uniref:AAA family ATPase n=1 Tax=Nonomuraea insulae TaxID=1616787 RepID=A0ABW1CU57_9ACTN
MGTTWPFAGREQELGHLLRLSRDPTAQGVLLAGPPGVGKSALAERLAGPRTGRMAGLLGGGLAIRAARALRDVPGGALATVIGGGGDSLARSALEHGGEVARAGSADTAHPAGTVEWYGEQVLRHSPAGLLLVDDAHLLDRPSAEVVAALVRAGRIRLVATVCPDEADTRPAGSGCVTGDHPTGRSGVTGPCSTGPTGMAGPCLIGAGGMTGTRPTGRTEGTHAGPTGIFEGADDGLALGAGEAGNCPTGCSEVVGGCPARCSEAGPCPIVGLWRDGWLRRFEVEPFSGADVAAVLAAALNGPVEDAAVARLAEITGGNALWLREVVEAARASGALQETDGVWRLAEDPAAGWGPGDLVERRVGALPADVGEVLEYAAFGEPIGVRTLAALCSDTAVQEALSHGVITVTAEGPEVITQPSPPPYTTPPTHPSGSTPPTHPSGSAPPEPPPHTAPPEPHAIPPEPPLHTAPQEPHAIPPEPHAIPPEPSPHTIPLARPLYVARPAHPLYGEAARSRCPVERRRDRYARLVAEAGACRSEDEARIAAWRLAGGLEADPGVLLGACELAGAVHDHQAAVRLARAALRAGGGTEAAIDLAATLSEAGDPRQAHEVLLRAEGHSRVPGDEAERVRLAVARARNLAWGLNRLGDALDLLTTTRKEVRNTGRRRDLDLKRAELLAEAARPEEALSLSDRLPGQDGMAKTRALALCHAGRTTEAVAVVQTTLRAHHPDAPPRTVDVLRGEGPGTSLYTTWALCGYFSGDLDIITGAIASMRHGWPGRSEQILARGRLAMLTGDLGAALLILRTPAGYETPLEAAERMAAYAMVQALRGDAAGARASLGAARVPVSWTALRHWRALAEVWVEAAAGGRSRAVELALGHAEECREGGPTSFEAVALHDAVRLGAPVSALPRLDELTTLHDGPRVRLASRHADALAGGDAAGLAEVAAGFDAVGLRLFGTEVRTQARTLRNGAPLRWRPA